MTDRDFRQSLHATLSYFDLSDHPLTLMELSRYRYVLSDDGAAPTLGQIAAALDHADFATRDGFWHLAGRDATVDVRQRRFRLAEAKLRRARRVVACMRLLPSVRLVAVCNSLAIANADVASDIDLFVVCLPGTLWITRLLVTGALALLRLRPTARTSADKVCMSFFVSERALDLSAVALGAEDDTYLRYWIATLLPLYDAGGVMEALLAANRWVAVRVPGALRARGGAGVSAPGRVMSPVIGLFAPLLRALDRPAAAFQRRKFPRAIRDLAGKDTRVVVTDDVLKFHVDDRRAWYERRFRERVAASGKTSASDVPSSMSPMLAAASAR